MSTGCSIFSLDELSLLEDLRHKAAAVKGWFICYVCVLYACTRGILDGSFFLIIELVDVDVAILALLKVHL